MHITRWPFRNVDLFTLLSVVSENSYFRALLTIMGVRIVSVFANLIVEQGTALFYFVSFPYSGFEHFFKRLSIICACVCENCLFASFSIFILKCSIFFSIIYKRFLCSMY